MRSSDGKTRDLITSRPGAGWDHNMNRHVYHALEARHGPHYTVYNRRFMCVAMDDLPTEEGYWLLRRKAACLHTGEWPIEIKGPDAVKLMDLLFVNNCARVRPGRCGYGLACHDDGGLIVDGVFLRLAEDRFWYVQADGDFLNWARAHARGMDVQIAGTDINVSQIQGPSSMAILEKAATGGMPEPFGYFGAAQVDFGGQRVWITRTGYTNELGWEFYTEPHHDPAALWTHLEAAGAEYGLRMFGLDSMNVRRIEAGILNAGSDFDETTTPFDVRLGRFVDFDKPDFIGKAALEKAATEPRLHGLSVEGGEPLVGGAIKIGGDMVGKITAAALSPFLRCGIGYGLLCSSEHGPGTKVMVETRGGAFLPGQLNDLPFYDQNADIPRGKRVDIPERPA